MNKRMLVVLATLFALSGLMTKFIFAASQSIDRQQFLQQFQAGENAFAQRNYAEAVKFFQQTLYLKPSQMRPRYRLGQSFLALGNHRASVQQFQTILDSSPNNIAARLGMVRGLIGMNRLAGAESQLKWILQVEPENYEAQQLYQACQSKSSDPLVDIETPANEMPNSTPGPEFIPAGFKPLQVQQVGIEALQECSNQIEKPAENGFKPLAQRTNQMTRIQRPPKPSNTPPPAMDVPGWQVKDFLSMAEDSYGVSLEYAKYCIEQDVLDKAQIYLDRAEKLAVEAKEPRQFLEVQIHRCLHLLYKGEIRQFGQKIMKIQPLLSEKTYKSFLDVYNRASTATSPVDVARLVGGIAMGAEHFAVASRIFTEVVINSPDDLLTWNLLSEAQLMSQNFPAAEKSLIQTLKLAPENSERALNLARFYLTGKFNPEMVRYYVEYARKIHADDPRIPVILALLDYSEGRIGLGLDRLKKFIPKIGRDEQLLAVCQRIMKDGADAQEHGQNPAQHFVSLLALPGSPYATSTSWNLLGESYLQRGSYFLAFMCYMKSKDLAEIGRTYLGLASQLCSIGEKKTAALAAGYGLNALKEEVDHNHDSSRAYLYLALYHAERKNTSVAQMHARKGLETNPPPATRRLLMGCLAGVKKQTFNDQNP